MKSRKKTKLNLEAASLVDAGLLREENEDCVWAQVYSASKKEPIGLFVVCDGMGGHMGGKYASYWAVEAIKREFGDLFINKDPRATLTLSEQDIKKVRSGQKISPKPPEIDLRSLTHSTIQKANTVVYEFAQHKPSQAANAGTTVSMAVVLGSRVVIANVGDSRTYLLRGHKLKQITRDHSLVANLVADGEILPDEVYDHPQRNVIHRFLGYKGMVQPDIFYEALRPGDYLLLCSDGLWEMIRSEKTMAQIIEKAANPNEACQNLAQAAIRAGGLDNIGIVVVKVT